jgi:Icc-related predicted phosphoesterase
MKMLFAADLHYTLKQLDWLVANAGRYDLVIIVGDLLDLGSALDFEVQIVVVHNAPFYPEGSWIDRIGDTWVFNPGREPGRFIPTSTWISTL